MLGGLFGGGDTRAGSDLSNAIRKARRLFVARRRGDVENKWDLVDNGLRDLPDLRIDVMGVLHWVSSNAYEKEIPRKLKGYE